MTERIYHEDPSLLEFDARVLEVAARDGRCEVRLDRTCFYPGGGGQPPDHGLLGTARVVETGYRGDEIVHVVEPALDPEAEGSEVHGSVDASRRRDYMEQHTGQHIVSQALMRAGSLPTVSVHFGEEHTTIELAAESVDDRTLERAEEMANGVIKENRRVILHEIDSTEASRFPLRRTPPDAGRLRIVEVDSFDWAACGGVHVASAGEVFLIKAVATERIRGRVRVHLMMGRRALRDYGRKVALAQELSRALTCGESFIADRVRELMTGARESAKELRRLRLAQAAAEADGAIASAQRVGGVTCVRQVFDAAGQEYLKAFVERVVAVPGRVVIAIDRHADGFQWIAAHSLGGRLELPAILPPLFEIAGARGGGRGARMQGAGTRSDAAAAFAEAVEAELGRRLRAGEGA